MSDYFQERITKIKLRIEVLEDAMLDLSSGAIESYSFDTGQSVQRVTKSDVEKIQNVIDGLLNQLVIYEARCSGNGVVRVVPGW